MNRKVSIPAYIFKSVTSNQITSETIKRQDDVLELEFPTYNKEEVLQIAEILHQRKRRAHDRSMDDLIEILDNVGKLWSNPNYDLRKEALEILPMTTGQSRQLCELELDSSCLMYNKKYIETQLNEELGGKMVLDSWVPTGKIRLHAQPQGLVFHNMAGNAFILSMGSLFITILTKNVNLVKLAREEPYFGVKFAESIAEVDKKLGKELAVLYWSGSRGEIYDSLFNSGFVDCVMAWGGLQSIEEIRRRAYRFGIKIIDHGPKLSFSIISDEMMQKPDLMQDVARKIAMDVVIFNQKACMSPRVIYIKENKPSSSSNGDKIDFNGFKNDKDKSSSNRGEEDLSNLMLRSVKLLRNEITNASPLGFAKILADEMKNADSRLPRANLTDADGMEVARKREYFSMEYEFKDKGVVLTPSKEKLNWTVVYLRDPPSMKEIDMCQDRCIIVTRMANIYDLLHFMQREHLQQYLQTISTYGSNEFVEEVAEEFSLIGAFRFPRVGENNMQLPGTPWDGSYPVKELVKWVYIGFPKDEPTSVEEKNGVLTSRQENLSEINQETRTGQRF